LGCTKVEQVSGAKQECNQHLPKKIWSF